MDAVAPKNKLKNLDLNLKVKGSEIIYQATNRIEGKPTDLRSLCKLKNLIQNSTIINSCQKIISRPVRVKTLQNEIQEREQNKGSSFQMKQEIKEEVDDEMKNGFEIITF